MLFEDRREDSAIEIMKEAHRKPSRPARAARATRGTKRVTWWDQTGTKTYRTISTAHRSKTKLSITPSHGVDSAEHMLGPNTKTSMANKPNAEHTPGSKTKSCMAMFRSYMTNRAPTTNIQQSDKKHSIYTTLSSRCGVFETIKRLSYLV